MLWLHGSNNRVRVYYFQQNQMLADKRLDNGPLIDHVIVNKGLEGYSSH